MYLNDKTRATLSTLVSSNFPADVYFDIDSSGECINVQASTQDKVKRVRAAFPGQMWAKEYAEDCKWWAYTTVLRDGTRVHIYACHEAPPTCRAIIEEVDVEESVPVQYAKRTVRKQVTRWDCSGTESEAS